MSKRINENGPVKKTRSLGDGQTLVTPYGKDSSDYRGVTPDKMRGGMNNLSHTLPGRGGKVNDD